MESSFMKLTAGSSRLNNYLGIKMDEGFAMRHPQQGSRGYAYVEIPVRELFNTTDETLVEKGMRNQYLKIVPACTVEVRGNYRFEVHPNPALYQYGLVQAPYYLEPEEGRLSPGFYIQLRRDMELSDIDWAVRIYMRV